MEPPREEALDGGNFSAVARAGDTVRRPTGAWTPNVHQMLAACADASVTGTQRVLGIEDGREVLTYVEGTRMDRLEPHEMWDPRLIDSACALLRGIHDATAPLVDLGGEWRSPRHEPAEVICHNDFAPYNLVVANGAVGAIDFDFASPGPRVWDLAYLAYRIVPFASDAPTGGLSLPVRERLDRLVRAYDGVGASEVMDTIPRRLAELAAFTREHARETGQEELLDHAAMYERDAESLRGTKGG